ncbi:MAG: zinc ribbon domain-containing protein [Acidobacteria bacterium]|nr:zinc ribbon domain-containing protein [Acidobacteriota bacterium]
MPLYEYECKQCGSVFEVRQKFSDDPLTTHEGCGGPIAKRLAAPAFQFKGTGWYITDYKKGNGGAPGKSDSKGDSKSESKSETKSGDSGSGSSSSASSSSGSSSSGSSSGSQTSNSSSK